jgi:hypothetical protein
MKVLSYALICLGIVYFALGQITFEKHEKVLDIGPIEATKTTETHLPSSPIFASAMVLSGTVLLIVSSRYRKN